MKFCEYCFHINEPDATHCSHCQRELPDRTYVVRDHPDTTQQEEDLALPGSVQPGAHTKHVGYMKPGTIALYVGNMNNPLLIQVENQVVLGRYTPDSRDNPPLDLEAFDAYEKGVSRLHAAIRSTGQGEYVILDLGSTNGTRVNGEPLTPHEPYRLHNGDLIRLGALDVYFYKV